MRKSMMIKPDPLWYKDAIIYELHIKSFFDSNDDGYGDFQGLIQKLDYIQDLGVNCIWLLPFYPSPLMDDGYDIADYRNINPVYGAMKDFKQFIKEAHSRDIRVITELVINHSSDQHPWFQAARKSPAGSSKRDYYVWSDTDQIFKDARIIFTDSEKSNWTWDSEAQAFYWHRFFYHQPDLNFDNPRVRRAVIKIMQYWLDMGVDGMRLDAIPYLIERENTNCENLPETHVVLKELRAAMDSRYTDRVFLAEANQWPIDVRPYFGDGDECHMAYHFPIMPRLFMGLHQEDRFPIVEIMRQTPDIPENCQWAIFLRNHDELTLEMVTDEERDYMYKAYAADPRMRINVGIRRRLAPLLEYSRRRIELLNSILLSFPGTPIIYYGDEIGMGDNIFLGDRNGVRTPMQWSGDRNGGFSRADFVRLFSPPLMDPVFGYQACNVEAQHRDPSSLLNWMKRIISIRKNYKAFGRGAIKFLHPENRKILAYIRQLDNEIILCVANLSRHSQPASIDLTDFRGLVPIEVFGQVEFPMITDAPYFLTLSAHSFYWFSLRQPSEFVTTSPPEKDSSGLCPLLNLKGSWKDLMAPENRKQLEKEVLPRFLASQRWFMGRNRTIEKVRVLEWGLLSTRSPLVYFSLVEVIYQSDGSEMYQIPMAIADQATADEALRNSQNAVLAQLVGDGENRVLYDATADDAACRVLLRAIEKKATFEAQGGEVVAFPTKALSKLRGSKKPNNEKIFSRIERSNTSIQIGKKLILKLFRRLQPGINPDFEIGRFLTESTKFASMPKTGGAIEYHTKKGQLMTLGLLQQMVPNQGDGWTYTVEELQRFFEQAPIFATHQESLVKVSGPLTQYLDQVIPETVLEFMGGYLRDAAVLGQRTAELHLALASKASDADFAPEPFKKKEIKQTAEQMKSQAVQVLDFLAANKRKLSKDMSDPAIIPLINQLLKKRDALLDRFDRMAKIKDELVKIRCHSDYHLGQVIRVKGDFFILDFEGEASFHFEERREKQPPMRDLACMLRSFSDATFTGLLSFTTYKPEDFEHYLPLAYICQTWISAAFLRTYIETINDSTLIPKDQAVLMQVVECYMLAKGLSELMAGLSMHAQASWLRMTLHTTLRVLDE